MSTSSSKKSKTNVRRVRDGVSAYRPGLQDFKRRGSESKSGRIGSDRERAIESQRSLLFTIGTAIFDGAPQELKNGFASIIPMGRMGNPDEIASAELFPASDDSSFVAGIELFVDGGTAQV